MHDFLEIFVDSKNKEYLYTSTELYAKFNDFVKSNNFKVDSASTKSGLYIKRYDDDIVKWITKKNIININILK